MIRQANRNVDKEVSMMMYFGLWHKAVLLLIPGVDRVSFDGLGVVHGYGGQALLLLMNHSAHSSRPFSTNRSDFLQHRSSLLLESSAA